jgi:hypothetical protein
MAIVTLLEAAWRFDHSDGSEVMGHPMPLDFEDLMRLYARQGIADWRDIKSTPHELQTRARDCLGWGIAQDETQAFVTIGTTYDGTNSDRLRFIPMPKRPSRPGIDRCFFLPIRTREHNYEEAVRFELFLLVTGRNCLAFRIEPPHRLSSAHSYVHAQLSRTMLGTSHEVKGIPDWLPDKYPAFPILASKPLSVFLCMATAVHGYDTGLVPVLQDVFQKASRASEVASYVDLLKKMLRDHACF